MKLDSALLFFLGLLASVAGAAEKPQQKTVFDGEYAEMQTVGNETKGFCRGSVTVTGTNIRLTCDRLDFIALGVGDKSGTATLPTLEKFKYLLATGHVKIIQGEREAACGRAELFPREDKIVLTDNPSVIDRGSGMNSEGEEIVMFRAERRVVVKKPHVEGPSMRDLGFDPKQPAPTPKAPAPAPEPTETPAITLPPTLPAPKPDPSK